MPEASSYNYEAVYSNHGLPEANIFRLLTASYRIKPDVFLIGAQKAGTTSLADYLSSVPGFISPWEKEISFFNNDLRFNKGENWYKSFFATKYYANKQYAKSGIKQRTFDATANTFEEIKSAKRIKTFNSQSKIVLILRNPILRAWSHYKMAVKYGFENKSFTEAIEIENERINSNKHIHNFAFQRLAYVKKGEYCNFLPEWQNAFGNDLLVLFYEELFHQPKSELIKLHMFLGVTTEPDPKKLLHLNKGQTTEINANDYNWLKEHYSPFNKQLEQQLNRNLPWQL